MKKLAALLMCITSVLYWPQFQLYGQGAWIEQMTDQDLSYHLFNRGKDCLGYAKENTQFVYFFDTNSHVWTTFDFGSEQTIQTIKSGEHVILVYTDEVAIAYSSITSGYDTLHYVGDLINPDNTDFHCGSGCSGNTAYFVTDKYFYVFDAETGSWENYYYYNGTVFSDNAFYVMPGDDYVGLVLRAGSSDYIVNIAYSLIQHSFAYTDNGGNFVFLAPYWMAHGFVTRNHFQGSTIYDLVGYCASTNQFDIQTIVLPEYYPLGEASCSYPENIGEKTVMVFDYTDEYEPGENIIQHFFAYSTTLGQWYTATVSTNPDYETAFGTFLLGGRVGVSSKRNFVNEEMTYVVFEGVNGTFHTVGALQNGFGSTLVVAQAGGDAVFAGDSTHFWFYNPITGSQSIVNAFSAFDAGVMIGDHFVAANSWEPDASETDKLVVFNSTTDNSTSIDLGFTHQIIYPLESPVMTGFAVGPSKMDVYLYSGITDSYTHIQFAYGNFANINVNDTIAFIRSQQGAEGYLYNAANNVTSTLPFNGVDFYSLGGKIALLTTENDVHAYNFNTMNYSEVSIEPYMGTIWAVGSIGLATNLNHSRFYAYNGFSDNWVVLVPEGDQTPYAVASDKTALVIRNDRIYAFDPFIVTGIEEQEPEKETGIRLLQNYPNPFYENTRIKYVLDRPGMVNLSIFDITGKNMEVLVNEIKTPGEYEVVLNRNSLPEGVYQVVLSTETEAQNIKITVLK